MKGQTKEFFYIFFGRPQMRIWEWGQNFVLCENVNIFIKIFVTR